MRCVCGLVLLAILFGGSGCAHLRPGGGGGAAGASAAEGSGNLALENKLLKQELALARGESDSLRAALEHTGRGADAPELARQLNAALRELADLRARYARLEADRAKPVVADGVNRTAAAAPDEKLAGAQRQATELEQESAQLRTELGQLRQENAALTVELTKSATAGDATQTTLAQLTRELAAEKQARIRAEQATESAFAQLRTVTAARSEADAVGAMTGPAPLPTATPAGPNPKPSEASPAPAPDRGRGNGSTPAASPQNMRTYVVQPGDTLERIAQQHLGSADRWRSIYDANSALLANGRALAPGMELTMPER